ncbi:AMP-binding protein, partial [Chitinimonas koreensis]
MTAIPATVTELLARLEARGVALALKGDKLAVSGDEAALADAALIAELRANKAALVELLRQGGAGRAAPPRLIAPGTQRITPELLNLVKLEQAEIDAIVAGVDGGAANVQDIYPLAPLQEGMLFHHLLDPAGDVYAESYLLGFAARPRLDRFLAALQQVVDRHDILRTGIVWDGLPQPVQVVRRHAALPVEFVALDPAGGDAAEQLQARYHPLRYRLDLARAPLLRCHAAQDPASGRWLLSVLVHHLAIDHTALQLLIEEAQAIEQGRLAQLPAPVPFRDFVAQARLGPGQAAHEAFFRQMLGDVDAPTAPFGLLDVQGDGSAVAEAQRRLDPALARALRQGARAHGMGPASLVHLAWALVLARASGRRAVVFGTVLFGRMQGGAEADRALGLLMNTLPLRIDVDALGVAERLLRTHAQLAQLLRHEHAPLALAQRCSAVPAQAPLFTALLNYRYSEAAAPAAAAGGDDEIEILLGRERTNYPLTLSVDDFGEDFGLTVQSAAPVAPERVCDFMVAALAQLVAALRDAPQRPAAALDVLPPAESAQLQQWNATARPYPAGLGVHRLFEAQARRTPAAIALEADGAQLDYAGLNARANRLARRLAALGVAADRPVAVCAERGTAMVEALLATLKAGGGYLPLDPELPAERLAELLRDSAPAALLVDAAGAAALADVALGGVPRLHLLADAGQWSALAADDLDLPFDDGQLAYVIYTSGSTGKPKGVMNAHRGVVNRLLWMQEAYGLGEHDVVLQKTPFNFDVSVWEFFWPLLAGARLVLARPGGHKDPAYLAGLIEAAGVTTLHFVPSMLQAFLAGDAADRCRSVARIFCSGEALPAALARQCLARLPWA